MAKVRLSPRHALAPFDDAVSQVAARVRAELEPEGQPIGPLHVLKVIVNAEAIRDRLQALRRR